MTRNIRILRTVCSSLSIDNRITVYRSIIEPYFNYCSIVWDSLTDTLSGKLQRLQNRAARIISGLPYSVRSNEIRTRLGWSSLDEIRKQGSKKTPSGRPGQVDFKLGQVTFHGHLPDGQVLSQNLCQLNSNICFSNDVSN